LITEKEEVFTHVFSMFCEGKLRSENGEIISVNPNTFCLHSDTPNSVEILQYLTEELLKNNIKIARK